MKTIIQRISDKKYLLSIESNTWTDNIEQAHKFTPSQLVSSYSELVKICRWNDFTEIKSR